MDPIHISLEIPLEEEETPEEETPSEIPDPITCAAKVAIGATKLTGSLLKGLYEVVKPTQSNENET